uniref:Co-chaperone protein p23-1 n=1 Tax=Brassica oleracea TaxID=3712 RepID=A0A3P6DMX7_BRAOL|nr:unnamed protein product [Brassica oleracea]
MEFEGGVLLPLFHEHPMMPWNDHMRKGDCCDCFEPQSDGYYCKLCDFFVHKKCGDELSEFIDHHPSHPDHTLRLQEKRGNTCDLCERKIQNLCYRCCDGCDFDVDLHCAKYPPPDVIDNFETHPHKLTLLKKNTLFDCSAKCGKTSGHISGFTVGYSLGFSSGLSYGLPYKCEECAVSFHVECVWHPAALDHQPEVNHPYHSLHPLKLRTGPPPNYSDGKCRLCGRKVDKELFYHCSSCNFTLDWRCVVNPPPQSVVDLKAHDHQLTLLPRLDSFTCNACGLKGDRSPYICVPCGFIIHQDCLKLPRVININRHDHRISRTSLLGDGAINSVCGVCRKEVDWKYGGFSCQRCPGYVVHSICAISYDVWNQKELEGIPEEEEDIEPCVVIDDNTIQHFSHEEHYLRLSGKVRILYEDNKWCSACTHPIGLHSFYGCMDCDFSLHQKCAECPKKKWHVLHNDRLTLSTNKELRVFSCDACNRTSNGFMYKHGDKMLDVLCGSISEPFVHPSHPHHPFYYIPTEKDGICNGCNIQKKHVLRCIEGNCRFALCFKCATEPKVVKHRVDDHPLSLCYGEEEEASGKYWCDICEKETDSKEWFYTCKDQRASLHRKCVLGDSTGLMPRTVANFLGIPHEVVLNNSVTRSFCIECNVYVASSLFSNKGSSFSKLHPLNMSRHPEVKWAETTDKIFLTVVLADSKETKVNLDPEGVFDFSAKAGPENHVYELKLELHGKVNVEESKINIGARSIFCIIEKAEPERWNKLIGGGKAPHYVKIDCDKWVDEDDEGSAGAGDMDMGGMGGMDFSVSLRIDFIVDSFFLQNFGEMGGMEGLGGMGGLGGMAELEGLGGMGGMGGMEEFEDSDDEGKEFAKPGDKKDEAVKEEAKPVDVVKEDK